MGIRRAASRSLGSAALAAIVVAGGHAAAAEPLAWKFAPGGSARYLLEQTDRTTIQGGPAGEIDSTIRQAMVVRWETADAKPSGAAVLLQTIERLRLESEGSAGQSFSIDSADPAPPLGMGALVAPLVAAQIAEPIRITIEPSGVASDVELSDALEDAIGRMPGGAVSADAVRRFASAFFFELPDGPLTPGQTWTARREASFAAVGPIVAQTTYRYAGPRERDAGQTGPPWEVFEPRLSLSLPAPLPDGVPPTSIQMRRAGGELLFDRALGRVVSGRAEAEFDVVVTVGEQDVVSRCSHATTFRELATAAPLPVETFPVFPDASDAATDAVTDAVTDAAAE